MNDHLNPQFINKVMDDLVSHMEKSKGKIFSFLENILKKLDELDCNIKDINIQIGIVIEEQEAAELKVKSSLERLNDVTYKLKNASEKDKDTWNEKYAKAYDTSSECKNELDKKRLQEDLLKRERTRLEDEYRSQKNFLGEIQEIMNHVTGALAYVSGDLKDVGEKLIQKQEFVFKILQTQEEERKRIAREIHDGPAQSLAVIVIRSQLIENLIKKKE